MCSVTVVFIHTMEDDQRLNTLVHEGDTLIMCFTDLYINEALMKVMRKVDTMTSTVCELDRPGTA